MKRLLLSALALSGVLVAGCGVQPTGVVPAGPAPAGFGSGRDSTQLTLYFLYDGRLTPVARNQADEVSPDAALKALFRGPSAAESAKGFFSLLPSGSPAVSVDTATSPVTVTVPYSAETLYPNGMNQIVCTTMAALSVSGLASGAYGISVHATDVQLDNLTCGTF
ncbi:GerMN domain-containing protein [Amycolatopsis jiangsuensis]|uniref:GerMN domain-containing protein n=1 Tax=Amycolatopsis jiangsuensis TaxID=1181879 RepID=A0A840IP48_9PSEU|nr:GerMN domain-containing protein [Amycolatopsis jiangsuensis]MBB4682844.1 hypothetical protein [Amycolatopsis jiangsuensis]